MKTPIYLDYNATAPLRPAARDAMTAALSAGPTNASSVHSFGRSARKMVEDARAQVAALVGAAPAQVVFNSGATEGNNTVLRFYGTPGARILISAVEHASIIEPGRGIGAEVIPVQPNGQVDVDALEKMCATGPAPVLISVMWVNNETGVINPVADVVRIARAHGAAVHVDAVQALGKIPVDVRALGADVVTVSSHKIGGPQGVGAMILGDAQAGACRPPPLWLVGGGQERSLRPGTENVAGIVGFGAAAGEVLRETNANKIPSPLHPRTQIENFLRDTTPDMVIFGAEVPRVTNTVCFAVPGRDAQTLLMRLDLAGIAVSSGSACSSGKVRESHVLRAMGVPEDLARGALRVSMGYGTTADEVDGFLAIWAKIMR